MARKKRESHQMTKSEEELEKKCEEAAIKSKIKQKKDKKKFARNSAYFENKPQLAEYIFGPKKTPVKKDIFGGNN